MGSLGFEFVVPGRDRRRFDVLSQICADPTRSQHGMGAEIGMSPAAVNRYIRELIDDGLVEVRGTTNKTIQYFLTDKGKSERERLVRAHTATLLTQAHEFRATIAAALSAWHREDLRGVVVAGADFNGGLVCVVAELVDLPVLALIDLDPSRHGDRFLGYVVQAPQVLEAGNWLPCGLMCLGASQAAEAQLREIAQRTGLQFVAM